MKEIRRNLPLSIETFRTIIENDYIYVDKTEHILKLISPGKKYFLSRPRRFGKSLLLSTIEELFKGNKKLFKGLYAENNWDWTKTFPVVKINFSTGEYNSNEELKTSLNDTIQLIANEYNISLVSKSIASKFKELIRKISEKENKKVVILIDEYDKAILNNIGNIKVLEDNQATMRSFYSVLKDLDQYIEFLFITGVSKFANISLFSDLNSPIDITLNKQFSSICGYTHQELINCFKEHINSLTIKLNKNNEEVIDKINYWYDGYSWDGETKIYSPYSTLELFFEEKFKNYWFKTATPNSLIKVFKNSKNYDDILKPVKVSDSYFDDFDFENIDPISFAFQTGYLTIAKEEEINNRIYYTLEFPNYEVESSLLDHLLKLNEEKMDLNDLKPKIIEAIGNYDNDTFKMYMKYFLTNIPARIHLDHEYYYQSIYLAWLNGLGFKGEGEAQTNIGLMDMYLETPDFIAIAEFKFSKMKTVTKKGQGKEKRQIKETKPIKSFDTMINEALNQINLKKYENKFLNRKVIKIAIVFSGKDVETEIEKVK
ncbi:MAG: ATP-binding protein [Methanobrevibacter sp.]|jgi:vacuolar-type H+-ATPase subunit F/Vma7|nr:ATP-binding protein [Candidatus Methanoflexus mossambicus]